MRMQTIIQCQHKLPEHDWVWDRWVQPTPRQIAPTFLFHRLARLNNLFQKRAFVCTSPWCCNATCHLSRKEPTHTFIIERSAIPRSSASISWVAIFWERELRDDASAQRLQGACLEPEHVNCKLIFKWKGKQSSGGQDCRACLHNTGTPKMCSYHFDCRGLS